MMSWDADGRGVLSDPQMRLMVEKDMDLYLNARQYNTSNSDNGRILIDRCTPFASPHSFISLPGCIVFQGGSWQAHVGFSGSLDKVSSCLHAADGRLPTSTRYVTC